MVEQPRYLITTADERTWYLDKPVVFLGRWCCLHERKNIWGNIDAQIVPPYGWDEGQKEVDFSYVQCLYEKLLIELTDELNRFHGTNHSLRYWRILIGPWLHSFTNILFNRWQTIQFAMNNFDIVKSKVIDFPIEQMVPQSQNDFEEKVLSHTWNHYIYGRILSGWTNCTCERIEPGILAKKNTVKHRSNYLFSRKKIKQLIRKGLNKISVLLSRSTDAFFLGSYLPRAQEMLLQLTLRQVPQFWQSQVEPTVLLDLLKRNELQSNKDQHKGFENCLRALMIEQIPTIFIEGYQSLLIASVRTGWPKNPRFIVTGNSAHGDEIFKIWLANKVESGTPYIFFQHGGLYGTGKYPTQFEMREVATADRFVTWGWTDGSKKHYPCLAITTAGKKESKWDPAGGALLINMIALRYTRDPWDIATQQIEYLKDQLLFIELLPEKIRSELTLRLTHADITHGYPREEIFRTHFSKLRISDGKSPIKKLIQESRLIIDTYNATTFLETLAQNIPTIMFWRPDHWEFRPSAQPYFDRLKQVGILHETPESAAKKVASVWDNVEGWWGQTEVQEARVYFCDRFARMPANPIRELRAALLSVVKNDN